MRSVLCLRLGLITITLCVCVCNITRSQWSNKHIGKKNIKMLVKKRVKVLIKELFCGPSGRRGNSMDGKATASLRFITLIISQAPAYISESPTYVFASANV